MLHYRADSINNKKAVPSQRCALYKWIHGGVPPTWINVTGNSAIRSVDPENPTLEPNMKCIGSPVAEIWPFAYLGAYGTPPIWGEGEVVGVSDGTFERAMVVSSPL